MVVLEQGVRVGIVAPGILLEPAAGHRQIQQVLYVLARLDSEEAMPVLQRDDYVSRIALCSPGKSAPADVAYSFYPRAAESAQ